MPFALIPFTLLVIPILEIAVFILVGNMIGLWPTLGLVLLTAIVGTLLLRQQGLSTLARIQADIRAKRIPGRDLVHGVMIAIAGVLLLTPGLVTDAVGFLLFVPKIRDGIWTFMKNRVVVVAQGAGEAGVWRPGGRGPQAGPRADGTPDVVDLSGEEFQRRPDPSSPWSDQGDQGETPSDRTLH